MARILVVDDDLLVANAIRMLLENKGFEIFTADGGEAGLNALDAETFDLMIVDIFMPHMRGLESIRTFHRRAPAIPLIAISGYVFAERGMGAPDFLRMALELGAACCLRKPFLPATLLSAVAVSLAENVVGNNASTIPVQGSMRAGA
ncbi:response regulator transcription factor [Bradyrhizobium sp.]|jgi:CheY-like chemotaxis protein|uniref:response regulator transcription factor n=1 Tax=Bradyrhizobium sp. TaxID=376 RepID=UPI003C1A2F9F